MSIFTALCRSRSVKLHALIWLLAIVLAVAVFTSGSSFAPNLLTAIGVRKTATVTATTASKAQHQQQVSVFNGNSARCQRVDNGALGDLLAVSQCSAADHQKQQQHQQPQHQQQDHHYEFHARVPASMKQWIECLISPVRILALLDSWQMVAVSVAVVFVLSVSWNFQ